MTLATWTTQALSPETQKVRCLMECSSMGQFERVARRCLHGVKSDDNITQIGSILKILRLSPAFPVRKQLPMHHACFCR